MNRIPKKEWPVLFNIRFTGKNSDFRCLTNSFALFLNFWCNFQFVSSKYQPGKRNQSFSIAVFKYTQIAKSIQSRGHLQDVVKIVTGRPLDLLTSALIHRKRLLDVRPMDIPWDLDILWISNEQSAGCPMD